MTRDVGHPVLDRRHTRDRNGTSARTPRIRGRGAIGGPTIAAPSAASNRNPRAAAYETRTPAGERRSAEKDLSGAALRGLKSATVRMAPVGPREPIDQVNNRFRFSRKVRVTLPTSAAPSVTEGASCSGQRSFGEPTHEHSTRTRVRVDCVVRHVRRTELRATDPGVLVSGGSIAGASVLERAAWSNASAIRGGDPARLPQRRRCQVARGLGLAPRLCRP